MAALFTTSDSGATNTKNKISYAQEHLTVHVVEVSLEEVLSAVAKEAKLEFVLNESIATKKVSVSFDKLSLEEGLKKIVRPFSYSMIFGHSGQLEKVIILESGSNSAKVTVSGKIDDPSPGPAGRTDDELLTNAPGLGPEGETAVPLEGEDYDSSLGPAGLTDEESPPNAPGPGPEGETAVPLEGEDYDPSLGPAGKPDEGPPSSAPGPQ